MPEGDTVHKVARAIAARLEGRRLVDSRLREVPGVSFAGASVSSVRALGKHLFVDLDTGLVVRSHLGMHGSWHRYAPGERWRRPEHQASIVLATEDDVFVCFNAKDVECARSGSLRSRATERRLGPDLIADDFDAAAIVTRARTIEPATPLIDVLLDQRVAAGIGNVYKCETLFIERAAPLRALGDTDDAALAKLYERARELLRRNLGGGARVTRDSSDGRGELWVYARARRGCLACNASIASARLGRGQRSTYWCPRCQAS